MSLKTLVSYDDTPNDQDALALARVLADVGAELTLVYVRHAKADDREREALEEHEAEALLERGARALGNLDVAQRVVVSGSTAEGLAWLAEREGAELIVFGSDYRTPAGHVAPQKSAQVLLEGGPAALAIAPAGYRSEQITTFGRVGVIAAPGDDTTIATARNLAERFGARVTRDEPHVDLLVVGSRPESPHGRVMISSAARNQVEQASSPVLVLPRGVTIGLPLALAA
jgi:nucleotide-binding universal stress UspA family protein